MTAWTNLLLAFTSGFAFGAAFTIFRFKSRIRFYKQFIESRLKIV